MKFSIGRIFSFQSGTIRISSRRKENTCGIDDSSGSRRKKGRIVQSGGKAAAYRRKGYRMANCSWPVAAVQKPTATVTTSLGKTVNCHHEFRSAYA
jgi:hypothetical protein